MKLRDSTPVEQNFSLIVSILGPGTSWNICKYVVKLLERPELHYNKTCRAEDLHNVSSYKHKSIFDGETMKEDELAKKTLEYHTYKKNDFFATKHRVAN